MADVSSNVQIFGDSMSEACVCVSLPATGDTATIDLGALVQAGQSGNRVAIIGIQSCGSFSMAWDSDSDYTFFYGNGTINIPNFISPIIMAAAPLLLNSKASPSPIPPPAPVITIRFPCKSIKVSSKMKNTKTDH